MTKLVDLIENTINKSFTQTNDMKLADIVLFKSIDSRFNEVLFVKNSQGSYLIGIALDKQNQLREANKGINTKGTNYSSIEMYKKNDENNRLPWRNEEEDWSFETIRKYFI